MSAVPPRNTAEPATSTSAPASATSGAVVGSTPPSISMCTGLSPISSRTPRPVARQRIQKLADEAWRAGLIEYDDNPAHRRSRLIRLTPQGEVAYADVAQRIGAWADELAADMDETEIRAALSVLRQLRERL